MNTALNQAISLIEKKTAEKKPLIIALEGGAATGKTTLAAQLAAHFQAPVISMDEFFLPPPHAYKGTLPGTRRQYSLRAL